MFRILALICLSLFCDIAQAQVIRAEPKLQLPSAAPAAPAAAAHASPGRVFPVVLGPPSADELAQLSPASKGAPLQVGFGRGVGPFQAEGGLRAALDWDTLPSGARVAAVSITSPEAAASRVALLVTSLPPGAVVRFYGDPGDVVFEAQGAKILEVIARNVASGDSSPEAHTYYSPRIEGTKATVEFEIPAGASPQDLHVAIPAISHFVTSAKKGYAIPKVIGNVGASGACENDVMCYPTWAVERQAVALMDFCEGNKCYWCTGTLLADTDPLSTIPYFQSANHCISTQTVASTLETDWFFQSTACNSGTMNPGAVQLMGGATLLYAQPSSDQAHYTDTSFMRLNNPPPAGAMYAGWIVGAVPAVGTAISGVHHPAGDLTKISFGSINGYFTCTPPTHSPGFSCSPATAAAANFYSVVWNDGVTEGGSSGSAIFDNAGQYARGQLYGGSSTCNNLAASDYYGRFDVAFNVKLKQWLSPPALLSVTSRKFHSGIGNFEVPIVPSIAISGPIAVESRVSGAGGHVIVFLFDTTVTATGTVTLTDANGATFGTGSPVASGSEVDVTLNGLPTTTRVKVTLDGVNGSGATYSASVGLLVGDADASRAVDSLDVDGVKAQSGLATTGGNYRYDLNLSGAVTAADILIAKGRMGLTI